ncbi:MAG: Sec-independent protein translocase protein TatB [Sulfurimonas sp.]|jgi:sec-independent protein translocase protein TatB|nr:Sec-independent protein translocase protein TatB [Sulfurimonas sp.]
MFGMGFTEILIVAVIAILFLGPDKLPSAMVEVAKFFRSVKKTIGTVKDSLEEELNVADIKEEALAYKKELLSASNEIKKASDVTKLGASLTNLDDDFLGDEPASKVKKESVKPEKVTFEKKPKKKKIEKEDSTDV